jgi:hypothetical protein
MVGTHLARSYDYVMDLLVREAGSVPYTYDPSGDKALRSAKRIRRGAIRDGGPDRVVDVARDEFGLRATDLRFAATLSQPLYEPARAPTS